MNAWEPEIAEGIPSKAQFDEEKAVGLLYNTIYPLFSVRNSHVVNYVISDSVVVSHYENKDQTHIMFSIDDGLSRHLKTKSFTAKKPTSKSEQPIFTRNPESAINFGRFHGNLLDESYFGRYVSLFRQGIEDKTIKPKISTKAKRVIAGIL